MAKPYPIPDKLVCSECGLAWNLHPEKAKLSDCVALLRKELADRIASSFQWSYTDSSWPPPHQLPYVITSN